MRERDDEGFGLVELLVVMIVLGVLASIAAPVFLSQRAKARDTATRQDVSAWGKEVGAYFVDGRGTLQSPDTASRPGYVVVRDDGATPYTLTVRLSPGTELADPALTNPADATNWCIALTNPAGSTKTFHYGAPTGLGPGPC
ncbi:prepilin-type N-terminal cleavage/methylation domain-containing protein [Kineococcus radiotolerans]|uniref:Prepilin-type N-terminal cleavage/methylation domain-containing protein n=1 Tax=Kineococcus radiotolerans TaxID=131568 RepID=A0A7W4XYS3_KINRA|nr:type II secretion system protein [Kineococcus radiotolerans]MBB2902837.1 prepilin-type N-terminal cleavage/methylation domain-containing protein [Kineococcus radiotolerans]